MLRLISANVLSDDANHSLNSKRKSEVNAVEMGKASIVSLLSGPSEIEPP